MHSTACTALHCAIYCGYATCCVVCLKAGIDADVGDLEGLCGGEVLQAATSISTDVRVGSSSLQPFRQLALHTPLSRMGL